MTTDLTSRVRANVCELIEEFGYLALGACAGTETATTEFVERLAGFVTHFGSMRRTRVAGHTLAGYKTPDEAAMNHLVQACSALELFHAAALAHDDIIDESDTRRHNPILHTGWGDARFGLAAGLLSGDALLVLCARAIDQIEHSIHRQLARFFQDVQLCTVIGEFQDALLEHHRVTTSRQTIATMSVNKTAWYTVTAPMTIAALCANVAQDALAPLAAAGATYGEAFQLLDDLRGLLSQSDAGIVRVPSRATVFRVLEELERRHPTFRLSAKRNRDIADRPDVVHGKLRPTRPGEYVLMDTTR